MLYAHTMVQNKFKTLKNHCIDWSRTVNAHKSSCQKVLQYSCLRGAFFIFFGCQHRCHKTKQNEAQKVEGSPINREEATDQKTTKLSPARVKTTYKEAHNEKKFKGNKKGGEERQANLRSSDQSKAVGAC